MACTRSFVNLHRQLEFSLTNEAAKESIALPKVESALVISHVDELAQRILQVLTVSQQGGVSTPVVR